MWLIGGILIYLAVKRDMEPALLLPMGFGAILVNLPMSGAVTQIVDGVEEIGVLNVLFDAGIANELFPLLLFVGIGAMIDFEPLLNDPKLMFFGAAAQFGIFFTFSLAALLGFPIKDAAAIGIIGAADGPTAIFMANFLRSNYLGAIMVAAYSYMALVPIVQPPVIRALTTTHERRIRMPYHQHTVSRRTKILFPIIITAVCGIVSPRSVALVGFLMFGNLIRVCGVLDSLSETAQKTLSNLITLFLGLTIALRMQAEYFLTKQTLLIMALGLVAFIFDTAGGVLVAKVINLFLPKEKKLNPMIGACGISAFPMSARVVYKMAIKEDPQNYLLMQCVGVNVSGQVASVIAGGLLLNLLV
ncbi:MAG: sodium ion-translocating decarboxylase subunit beta [Oscillospiraceae bacterium]|nr:sodium ion-translocating decarboxylase subunit beta [Oscillospiraceae bacterium]